MARRDDDPSDLALFAEDDLHPDHTATNLMMDNRVRLDELDIQQKAKLAELLATFDAAKSIPEGSSGVGIESAYQNFLAEQLDSVKAARTSGCFYCHNVIDPEATMVRQTMWTDAGTRKKIRHREDTGDAACEGCVDRVSEGGDPQTKPMF